MWRTLFFYYVIYPPKQYQEKLKKYHGRKVKAIVIIEPE